MFAKRCMTILAVTMTVGCSQTTMNMSPSSTDAGGGGDLAMAAVSCSGTLVGYVAGKFGCAVSITQEPGDQIIRLTPHGWMGDALSMTLVDAFVPDGLHVRSYSMTDLLNGTGATFLAESGVRYAAGKDDQGRVTGDLKLTVTSPPQPPPGDLPAWDDTHVHGNLHGTLPHDPNTPGMQGTSDTLDITF